MNHNHVRSNTYTSFAAAPRCQRGEGGYKQNKKIIFINGPCTFLVFCNRNGRAPFVLVALKSENATGSHQGRLERRYDFTPGCASLSCSVRMPVRIAVFENAI